ncbi:MAG: hypothetical protein ACFCD0_12580 [Gemmataceae bacterium]
MQNVFCGLAALAVANIYYWYRSYQQEQLARHRTLRERVAYMLWVTATRVHV